MVNVIKASSSGGLGRLAAWDLPGGPVGPPARWASTSNVEGGCGTERGAPGPLCRTGGSTRIIIYRGLLVPGHATAHEAGPPN